MRLAYDVHQEISEEIELNRSALLQPGITKGQAAVAEERIKLLEKQNPLLPTRMTPEAMLEDLGKDMGGGIVLSELGEWLANMKKGPFADFKGLITSFYDCPPFYQYKTRNCGNYIIRYPFITINSVSTLQWIAEHLKPSDVESGFFARFLIFCPPRKPIMPPALPEDALQQDHSSYLAFKAAVTSIKEPVAFVLDESAKCAFRNVHAFLFNEFLGGENSELLEPYVKRWGPYVLKLAMIMQVMLEPGSSRITAKSIEAGYSVVEYAIRSTLHLFKQHLELPATAKLEQKIIDYIAKRGGTILRHQLQGSRLLDGGSKAYDDIITSLVDQGLITVISGTKKQLYQYTLSESPGPI